MYSFKGKFVLISSSDTEIISTTVVYANEAAIAKAFIEISKSPEATKYCAVLADMIIYQGKMPLTAKDIESLAYHIARSAE